MLSEIRQAQKRHMWHVFTYLWKLRKVDSIEVERIKNEYEILKPQ
jgi:hypothetical protein